MTALDLSLPAVCAHELADEAPGVLAPPPVLFDERPRLTPRLERALAAVPRGGIHWRRVAARLQVDERVALSSLHALRKLGLVTERNHVFSLTTLGAAL